MSNDMKNKRDANRILADSFLEVRAKLLEVAAVLDRLDRASDANGPLDADAQGQRDRVAQAIELLLNEGPDRAARLQLLFSREYDEGWRDAMQL